MSREFIYRLRITLSSSFHNGEAKNSYYVEVIQVPVKEGKKTYNIIGGGGYDKRLSKEKIGKVDTILMNVINGRNNTLCFHAYVEEESEIEAMAEELENRLVEYFSGLALCVENMQYMVNEVGLKKDLKPLLWKDNKYNPDNTDIGKIRKLILEE